MGNLLWKTTSGLLSQRRISSGIDCKGLEQSEYAEATRPDSGNPLLRQWKNAYIPSPDCDNVEKTKSCWKNTLLPVSTKPLRMNLVDEHVGGITHKGWSVRHFGSGMHRF